MVSDYSRTEFGSTSRMYMSLALGSLCLKARSHFTATSGWFSFIAPVFFSCKICKALEIQKQLVPRGV